MELSTYEASEIHKDSEYVHVEEREGEIENKNFRKGLQEQNFLQRERERTRRSFLEKKNNCGMKAAQKETS